MVNVHFLLNFRLQVRRNFGERVLSTFLTKIMAAIFHFNGSGRLGREGNLYQGDGRRSCCFLSRRKFCAVRQCPDVSNFVSDFIKIVLLLLASRDRLLGAYKEE